MNFAITPPPELVQQWFEEANTEETMAEVKEAFATRAAQWGADQELRDVCQLLFSDPSASYTLSEIRAARRPKPPSLKKQALALLDKAEDPSWDINDFSIVRKALEQLPE